LCLIAAGSARSPLVQYTSGAYTTTLDGFIENHLRWFVRQPARWYCPKMDDLENVAENGLLCFVNPENVVF